MFFWGGDWRSGLALQYLKKYFFATLSQDKHLPKNVYMDILLDVVTRRTYIVMCMRISWTEYKTNVWVRQKIGVPEQNGLFEQLKKRKLAKYGHWKRRSEGLVMAVTEGEIEGKCLPGRRRTAWIDNVGRWTEGGLSAARRIALDRL